MVEIDPTFRIKASQPKWSLEQLIISFWFVVLAAFVTFIFLSISYKHIQQSHKMADNMLIIPVQRTL